MAHSVFGYPLSVLDCLRDQVLLRAELADMFECVEVFEARLEGSLSLDCLREGSPKREVANETRLAL